jgi:hypothetical protein
LFHNTEIGLGQRIYLVSAFAVENDWNSAAPSQAAGMAATEILAFGDFDLLNIHRLEWEKSGEIYSWKQVMASKQLMIVCGESREPSPSKASLTKQGF